MIRITAVRAMYAIDLHDDHAPTGDQDRTIILSAQDALSLIAAQFPQEFARIAATLVEKKP